MSINLTEEHNLAPLPKLPPTRHSSFTTCTAEYYGTKSPEEIEAFLTATSVFKQVENISDAEALRGISLLLKEDAASWWEGVKDQVTTWDNFKDQLRHAFAPKKPDYVLYQEIMGKNQDPHSSTVNFIEHKRILFAQLSPPILPESQQLDMIYGALSNWIREKVPRDSFTSYNELLQAAREVERTTEKKRCRFCRFKGHLVEECKKLKKKQETLKKEDTVLRPILKFSEAFPSLSPSALRIHCNGCGASGVVQGSCPTCARNIAAQSADLISRAENTTLDIRNRPTVLVEIAGIKGCAYIDTGASFSILAYQLYKEVAQKGHKFNEEVAWVTLADGIEKEQRVLKATLPVKLESRVIPTTFTIVPESKDTRTLLGVGFIKEAKMFLNLPQFTWRFVDGDTIFQLYEED